MSFCLSILLAVFRTVVIPVQFQDVKFTCSMEELETITTQSAEYFNKELHGARSFEFNLVPIQTASKTLSYYGANSSDRRDTYLFEAAYDAIKAIDESVDFSKYDNDGDGVVEHVMFIFAGGSEADGAGEDHIWPQQTLFESRSLSVYCDGRQINSYASCCELGPDGKLAGIGTFCHEFCHGLGIPDFYDTDGTASGGLSRGLWKELSLMDGGDKLGDGHTPPPLCAVELDLLGAGECTLLEKGEWTLEPVNLNGKYLKCPSETDNEYWLIECRSGRGLLVYHVDRSDNDAGYSDFYKRNLSATERWSLNQVNCNPLHECVNILPAEKDPEEASQLFFPQEGRTGFSSGSKGGLISWNGSFPNISVSDIRINSDGSTSFNVSIPAYGMNVTCYQDAALLSWKTDPSLKISTAEISWLRDGEKISSKQVSPYTEGAYSTMLEKLQSGVEYRATIKMQDSKGAEHKFSMSFTTKQIKDGTIPYIYLKDTERHEDGAFKLDSRLPLRVFNAPDISSVEWYMDQTKISAGEDGTYHIRKSGTLRAVVHYFNGNVETIEKALKVK